ncbi:MAG: antirestriction protein ArdA [Clostridia bacterium]|nr:antirestriction protein ArdA [Clostridia bacterium]
MERRISIYLTNLGKYVEGCLMGEWVKLPVDKDKLQDVLDRIGIDGQQYEEYFISDYEALLGNLHISEYSSIQELNELAERLEGLADPDYEKLAAVLECESSMSIAGVLDIIDELDNFDLLEDVADDEALAAYYIDNGYIFCDVPDNIKTYLDLQRLGRDIRLESNICYTSYGTVVDNR